MLREELYIYIASMICSELSVTPVDVSRALKNLKSRKKPNDNLSSVLCVMLPLLLPLHSQLCLHPF